MIPEIEIKTAEEVKVSFSDIDKNHFVDIAVDLKFPPIAISIGETTKGDKSYPIPFATYGNFSCIVGASKSRKTFLKSLIESVYIGGKAVNRAGAMRSHREGDKYILSFDTEQGEWSAQQSFRRHVDICGGVYDNYRPYAFRELDFKTRLDYIECLILDSPYSKNLGLVTIDGIVDLVPDANDLVKCNELLQRLMKWSTLSNCHIITILHKNFGTSKPTGHLGSAILKKAETVVMVDVDQDNKEVSNLKFEYTRTYPIDSFGITIDENWLPYVCEGSGDMQGF